MFIFDLMWNDPRAKWGQVPREHKQTGVRTKTTVIPFMTQTSYFLVFLEICISLRPMPVKIPSPFKLP